MNYLLIDDDEVFSATLSRALQRRDCESSTATTGESALKILAENPTAFRRAIVDLNLDGESGIALIEPLLDINPELEILVLTGFSSITTTVDAIKKGARNYLCKPSTLDEILAAFEENETPTELDNVQPHSIQRLEWEHIQTVLHQNDGNISATARALGMHRRTLQRKLQKKPVSR